MTLKTLKQKQNISLTIEDDFIQYCKLNNIEDVESLAKETFKRGFDLLKYGYIQPKVVVFPNPEKLLKAMDKVVQEVISPKPSSVVIEKNEPIKEEPKRVEAIPMKSTDGTEAFSKIGRIVEKKDLYDE